MRLFGYIMAGVGTAALAVLLFAAGYFACSLPITTQLLSQGTSDFERSPYALDDLNSLAVASRDLTVDARPAGTSAEDARASFNEALMLAATHSAARYLGGDVNGIDVSDKEKRQMWSDLLADMGAASPAQAFTLEDVNATASQMAAFSAAFALDGDAFGHLDDCNALIQSAIGFVTGAGVVFLVCLMALLVTRNRRAMGVMLVVAPVVLLVCFALMGAWAIVDFRAFFAAFHGVFFPQGNWTFPVDSLLICMYPTAFWMGMGILWLATTAVASIIMLAIGAKALRGTR